MYKSTKYLLDMNENRIVAIRHVFTEIRKRYHAVETWKTFAISIPRKLYIVAFQFIARLPANFDVLYATRCTSAETEDSAPYIETVSYALLVSERYTQ